MDGLYAVFKEYNYNDENLSDREQKLVNAAKTIIKDSEAKVDLYKSKNDFLETRVKNLTEEVGNLGKPILNPKVLSDQNFNVRERFLIDQNFEISSKLENCQEQLNNSNLELKFSKEKIEKFESSVTYSKLKVQQLGKELKAEKDENEILKEKLNELEEDVYNRFDWKNEENKAHYYSKRAERFYARSRKLTEQMAKNVELTELKYKILSNQLAIIDAKNAQNTVEVQTEDAQYSQMQIEVKQIQNDVEWYLNLIKVMFGIVLAMGFQIFFSKL